MPSADQVPINFTHSTMLGGNWVVLIAGSTGSALRAVRPPNRHITPTTGGIDCRPEGHALESASTQAGSPDSPERPEPIRSGMSEPFRLAS